MEQLRNKLKMKGESDFIKKEGAVKDPLSLKIMKFKLLKKLLFLNIIILMVS